MGVAGVGKSTLARGILQNVCAVYLDNNHIADAFFPDRREGSRYERLRRSFYKVLYTIAAENLKLGSSVLLDVPHVREMQSADWRAFIADLAETHHARLVVIYCKCSEQLLRLRLASRGEPRDQHKLDRWAEFLAAQPLDMAIPYPHLAIDTSRRLDANVREAVGYIHDATMPGIGARSPGT
jgi:predicted kinase